MSVLTIDNALTSYIDAKDKEIVSLKKTKTITHKKQKRRQKNILTNISKKKYKSATKEVTKCR